SCNIKDNQNLTKFEQNAIFIQEKNYDAIFPTISRINHSCIPNCHFVYNIKNNCGRIIANKNIKKNEEITISYIKLYLTYDERQFILKNKYNFICKCNLCLLHFNN